MLNVFIAAFVLFLPAFLDMSLGYIIKCKSIPGSCGELSGIGVEKVCDCPGPCDARKKCMTREQTRQKMLEKTASYRMVIIF